MLEFLVKKKINTKIKIKCAIQNLENSDTLGLQSHRLKCRVRLNKRPDIIPRRFAGDIPFTE